MPDRDLDLRALLAAVEAAPPTAGVEALAAELVRLTGAAEISFLISDIVGGTLVRLARVGPDGAAPPERTPADSVPIEGTAAGLALRRQQVQVQPGSPSAGPVEPEDEGARGGSTWLFAPVTERGEAIGVLELLLPVPPDERTVDYVASAAHALA